MKKRFVSMLLMCLLVFSVLPVSAQEDCDHFWDDWEITQSATIKKSGVKERECLDCGEIQTKEIAKLTPYIKLSKKSITLKVGKTRKLKVKYAKGDSVKKWKSSNKKIATVSKKGKITAKKPGTVKITVKLKSGKKAVCKVKVKANKKKSSGSSSHHSSNHSNSGTVYWTPGGSVYHSTRNCATLRRSRTICSGSLSSCPKSRGCKVCH